MFGQLLHDKRTAKNLTMQQLADLLSAKYNTKIRGAVTGYQ